MQSGDPRRADDFELRPGETVPLSPQTGADGAARRFRDVLGRFASGVTVVTASSEGRPVGLTVQSFMSASLEPPLVLAAIARTARSWPAIERAGAYCVNLLAADQEALAVRMATRGIDKFAGVEWSPSAVTGSPVLGGGMGYVDCRIESVHEAGDHFLVLGRVVDLVHTDRDRPLLFYRGRYRRTS
jgi:3-hydroxy-9,10-secoandrosta-1,3,5(10)-triene-9,17-dione monooxygenase reductase component